MTNTSITSLTFRRRGQWYRSTSDGIVFKTAGQDDYSPLCDCQTRYAVPEPLNCQHSIYYHDAYETSLYTPEK